MALVLPSDATHVRYSRPFWQHLCDTYSEVRVQKVNERIFTDIAQDVVLLFAAGKGGSTQHIKYEVFDRFTDVSTNHPTTSVLIEISEWLENRRAFAMAHTDPATAKIIQRSRRLRDAVHLKDLLEIRIGYVAGDKNFFHPSAVERALYQLDENSTSNTLQNARQLRGHGLFTSQIDDLSRLFTPRDVPTDGERAYIQAGEDKAVNERYKCRARSPWYQVPRTGPAELLWPVFGDTPRLLANDGQVLASNSYLTANIRDSRVTVDQILSGWYTSFTRLEMETKVHSLGGGVLVMIPGEVGRIRLPVARNTSHLGEISRLLAAGDVDEAYALGDQVVLVEEFGLPSREVETFRAEARAAALRRRRKA